MIAKMCMLEENKICDDCLECNSCDLEPGKICDNCAKCIEESESYRSVEIKDIVYVGGSKKTFRLINSKEVEKDCKDIKKNSGIMI